MTSQGDSNHKTELIELIHQFLANQIAEDRELSEAAKESLTVAIECIEQSYKIQKKNPSSELLDLYKASKQSTSGNQATSSNVNPVDLLRNLANNILSQASSGSSSGGSNLQGSNPASSSEETPNSAAKSPKTRKEVSPAERIAAESFKNQGNDLMKEDRYKEAFDCYTRAIEIDDNNAIYYSNRAAASSKLGNHQAALDDCLEAIEIDPTYSKAYGRMGLAYASLDNHQKAKDAYLKAVELDPHNEGYKNNLRIAEEKLGSTTGGAVPGLGGIASELAGLAGGLAGGQENISNMLRSMMGNPELVQMAMRSLQDPRMQNLFGSLSGGANANAGNRQ